MVFSRESDGAFLPITCVIYETTQLRSNPPHTARSNMAKGIVDEVYMEKVRLFSFLLQFFLCPAEKTGS